MADFMPVATVVMTTINVPVAEESDYGEFPSDTEELQILELLLTQAENDAPATVDIEDYEQPQSIRLPKIYHFESRQSTQAQVDIEVLCETAIVEERRTGKASAEPEPEPPSQPLQEDKRSPLEKFRRPPKKALSVTDLISPAWCELQYFYTLSKHGRKKRTPAMKQGTAVHQALEEEVHTTVPIEITKKEDGWGLRIWNIIQGLRTLRETGRTRELEVWGTVGGELVNGIIDELSYECPDPRYEENLKGLKDPTAELPEYQMSITDYLLVGGQKESQTGVEGLKPASTKSKDDGQRWIYMTDVKTRGSPTLPSGSSLKPTILQLHLYHHMLENIALGNFELTQLSERYNLDVDDTFSESFLTQLNKLNLNLDEMASSQEEPVQSSQASSAHDSMVTLLQHDNLSTLWDLMMSEFRTTFIISQQPKPAEPFTSTPQSVSDIPVTPNQPTRLSPLLTAEYLAPTYKHISGTKKKSIGKKSFGFNAAFLRLYLEDNLAWWRGERDPRGVQLQEAWKCRSCDFKTDCRWILDRDDAALQEALERKRMRDIAGVESPGVSRSNV